VEGAASRRAATSSPTSSPPSCLTRCPAGAFLYAGASDLERQLGTLRDFLAEVAPGIERDIGRAESQIGVSLDEDVFPLFSAESALYLRPGFPIPEATIVTQVDDEQGALAVIDKLANEVSEYYGIAELHSIDIEGVQAKELVVNQFFSVYYAAFDGKLVITTSRQGIADLEADGDRLADDEAFKDATEAAGMPSETTGFLYVDFDKALPTLFGLLGFSGQATPDWLERNLEPLQSLVLYGERGRRQSPARRIAFDSVAFSAHGARVSLHVRVGHRGSPGQGRGPGLGHDPRRSPDGRPERAASRARRS
jgi:hypothetical protein